MSPPPESLSIIIPAMNEGTSIGDVIRRARAQLEPLGIALEILVVDGGSTDGTEHWAAEAGARVLRQPGRGYADALLTGLRATGGTYVISMDADYSHDPDFLCSLWAHREEAEVLIASRYVDGGYGQVSWSRKLQSRLLNRLSASLLSLPVRDLSSGFRLYHRRVLAGLAPRATNFDVLIELLTLIHSDGWRVKELPFHYRPRWGGRSHASLVRFAIGYVRTLGRMWVVRNSLESADYDNRAFSSRIPLQRYWQRRRYAIVLSMLERADHVLDVGCGAGKILEALPGAVGVDLNFKPLRFRLRTNSCLVNGDIRALPFPAQVFGAVICSELLEHLPYDPRTFSELVRVLRPGGLLIVGTPDYGRWQWRFIEWWYRRLLPGAHGHMHVERYTEASLRRRLEESGVDVLTADTICRAELILKCRKR